MLTALSWFEKLGRGVSDCEGRECYGSVLDNF